MLELLLCSVLTILPDYLLVREQFPNLIARPLVNPVDGMIHFTRTVPFRMASTMSTNQRMIAFHHMALRKGR